MCIKVGLSKFIYTYCDGISSGKCQCDEGFFGDDCAWDENKVPVLFDMQFEGLCDLQSRPCGSSPVYGDYFLRKPTLSCGITPVVVISLYNL